MKYAFTIAAVAGLAAASAHAGHERLHRRAGDMVTVTDWTVVTVTDVVTVVGPSPIAKDTSVVAPSSAASSVSVPPVQSAPSPVSSSPSSAPVVATPIAQSPSTPAQQQTTLQTVASQIPKPQPQPTTISAAAAAPTSPSTGGSGNGNFGLQQGATVPANCPKDKPCQGDMTTYSPNVGMGSCGYTDSNDDDVVAISAAMWGSLSSFGVNQPANKLCDKKIQITNPATGQTAVGTIRDKCPGCTGTAGIDLSPSLMVKVHGIADDRIPVEWYFL